MSTRNTRTRRLWSVMAAFALALTASLSFAGPANADPFGLDQEGNLVSGVGGIPDDFNHTYCFNGAGWTAAWQTLANGRMANLDTQTSYVDVLDPSCDGNTDIWFQLANLGGTRGDYRCEDWNAAGTLCVTSIVRISNVAAVLPDNHQKAKTICHEVGHSVGLAHGTTVDFWTDCMLSGVAPAGVQYEQYTVHHRNHANSRTPDLD
jgi:hypothetical protein